MLDVVVYPECLACQWPDFEVIDTGIILHLECEERSQRITCSNVHVCDQIKDSLLIDMALKAVG